MSFKDIIYCIGIGLLLFEILKSFIFQIRPADKEKILLKYAPKKPFFIVSVIFSAAWLNVRFVMIMNPDEVYYVF